MRYGILLLESELAVDIMTQRPVTYAHRQSAARAMVRSMPEWLASAARVVKVEVDDNTFTVRR